MKKLVVGCLIIGMAMVTACGGSSSGTSSDSPTFESISDLPKATSPMASVSASVSASIKDVNVTKAAETGLNLTSTTSADFSTSSSMGACQMFNNIKEGIVSAAQADQIMCYVSHMQDSFGDSVDVYDGAWHIFNLNVKDCSTDAECITMTGEATATCNANGICEVGGEEASYTPSRVKLQIVKDSAGSIISFEMFMCNADLVQNEYTKQTISGTTLTMRAIGHHSDPNGSGWHSVDVAGTLNSSGVFTAKTITMRNNGSWGSEGNTNWQEGTLVQEPGSFTFYGYNSGNYSFEGTTGSYIDIAYGAGEMLSDTSTDIRDVAMGDGAVQYSTTGTYDGGTWTDGATVAWLGDGGLPLLPPTNSSFYNTANDGTMPTAAASMISIAFASGETWDCTDDAGVGIVDLPESQASGMETACAQYGAMQHGWIDCWQLIESTP